METRSPGRWSAGQALGIRLIVVGGLYLEPGVEAGVVTNRLLSVEGRTETLGYAASPNRVSVQVDGTAGSVRIRGTR